MELLFESTDEGLRVRAPWRLLLQFTLFLVCLVFLPTLLTALWNSLEPGNLRIKNPMSSTKVNASPALFLVNALAYLGAVLLSVWTAGRFLDRRPFKDFGFHLGGGWLLDLLFGMGLGALLMTGLFLIELGFGWVSVAGTPRPVEPNTFFSLALIVPIVSFICVGVNEELLFRGYWLRNLAEGGNFPFVGPRYAVFLAWVGSSVFFGFGHAGNPGATILGTVTIMVVGLMFGLAYALTGELAVPIGLHVAWNFFESNVFALSVYGIGPNLVTTKQGGPTLWTGGGFGPEAGLLGVIAALLGCFLITLWVRFRRGKVSILASIAEPPKPLLPNGSAPEQTSG